MAVTAFETKSEIRGAGLRSALGTFTGSLRDAFNLYIERASRSDQVKRLNMKSDAELAKLGLRREDIPMYVFRDLMHL
ncbi:MAG: hypothetical protein ACU0FH_19915 [Heliomarina sp.]|uniref:hypothetical protein n=1 Tax=Heliomarina sp. TaxID=2917556 RepID=UPI00405941D0